MKNNPWILYILTALVLGAAYIRHSVHDSHDAYKCNAALSTGKWLDPPTSHRSPQPFQKWQPDGCMTQAITGKNAITCLGAAGEKENIFIGDSTVREVFWGAARQLNKKAAVDAATKAEKHADITFTEGRTTLEFVWDPYWNSSRITQYLSRTQSNAEGTELESDKGIVVIGGGLWFAIQEEGSVEKFQNAADAIFGHLALPDLYSKGLHRPLVMPVQPPYYDKLDENHKPTMTATKINAMNAYLADLAQSHDIDLLRSFLNMVKDAPATAYEPKGLHVMPTIADKQAELILNLRCNDKDREYTFDGTCCFDYTVDWASLILILAGLVMLVVVTWVELQASMGHGLAGFFENAQTRLPTLWPILIMWAGLMYCWLCDRTHLFNKVQKLYNAQDFYIFCIGIIIAGAATVRRSASPQRPGQEKPANVDQPFLSRDQTDEWKGWMQLLILAYHYTGGSKVLWVYKIIRLLVASYLFMTGYGHAAYFYQKGDFSMKRVVAVLIRLNLLSCLLPWMMGTDYLFYYFAPLVTYWYAIIYITMWVKSDWNQKMPLFLAKVGVMASITTMLHTQPWLLDPAFKMINMVFGAKWEAKEWLFRCALDQFIVYIGMIVSVMYIRATKPPPPPPPPQGAMSTTSHRVPGRSPQLKEGLYFVGSGLALVVYAYASSFGTTKTTSNALHTYISPLPILAFIHLRNCTRGMRNQYSTSYAWIGKISLETFVLQYHLWLAGDTKGLLSLGWFGDGGMDSGSGLLGAGMGLGRWMDCIVLGIVFVYVSLKVANATGGITSAIMKAIF